MNEKNNSKCLFSRLTGHFPDRASCFQKLFVLSGKTHQKYDKFSQKVQRVFSAYNCLENSPAKKTREFLVSLATMVRTMTIKGGY